MIPSDDTRFRIILFSSCNVTYCIIFVVDYIRSCCGYCVLQGTLLTIEHFQYHIFSVRTKAYGYYAPFRDNQCNVLEELCAFQVLATLFGYELTL